MKQIQLTRSLADSEAECGAARNAHLDVTNRVPTWYKANATTSVVEDFGSNQKVWTKAEVSKGWFPTTRKQIKESFRRLRKPKQRDVKFTEKQKEILDKLRSKGKLLKTQPQSYRLPEGISYVASRVEGSSFPVTRWTLQDFECKLPTGVGFNINSEVTERKLEREAPGVARATSRKQKKEKCVSKFSSETIPEAEARTMNVVDFDVPEIRRILVKGFEWTAFVKDWDEARLNDFELVAHEQLRDVQRKHLSQLRKQKFRKKEAKYMAIARVMRDEPMFTELLAGPPQLKETVTEEELISAFLAFPEEVDYAYMRRIRGGLIYVSDLLSLIGSELQRRREARFFKIPTAESKIGTTSEEQNTTFTDERQIVREEGYLTTQTQPNLQNVSMQEGEWHVREILAKPLIFKIQPWKFSDETRKVLYKCQIPGDVITGPHKNLIEDFVFFRGHPKVRIQLNSTGFHYGVLMAVFIPMYSKPNYTDVLWTPDVLLTCPHVKLDAGICNSGIIDVPFVHMNTYFNSMTSRAQDYLGEFQLIVFNRLGGTTGASPEVDVTCWISFDKCELHQPCQRHDVKFPKMPTAEAGVEGLMKSVMPIAQQVMPQLTSTLGNVTGMSSNCDKPTDPQEVTRWVPNAVTSLNFGDGLDRSNRISLQTGTYTVSDSDMISTTRDDANLKLLMRIPTRLLITKWKTSYGPKHILFTIPVYPTVCVDRYEDEAVHPSMSVYEVTNLSYFTRSFKFWRGSLEYLIQVVASTKLSGRLQFSFIPGFGTQDFSECNFVNTYIMDLQEKHEVGFVAPYMSERPWLRCDKLSPVSFVRAGDAPDLDRQTGMIVCHVVNRLTCPDTLAQEIEVNVFINAGKDFEVAFVTDMAFYQGSGKPVAEAFVGAKEVTTRQETGASILTKRGGMISSSATSTMSENAMDLKVVLRRYTKVFEISGKFVAGHAFMSFINSPTLSGVNKRYGDKDEGKQYRTVLCHMTEPFVFWGGSLRYKLVFLTARTDGVLINIVHVPGVFKTDFKIHGGDDEEAMLMGALEAGGTMVAVSRVQNSLEFEIPFYTPYTQLQTLSGNKYDAKAATGTVYIQLRSTADTEIAFSLYQAAGDDFRLNYFRAVPRMCFPKGLEQRRCTSDTAEDPYDTAAAPTAEMFAGIKNAASAAWSLPSTAVETMTVVKKTCNTVTEAVQSTGLVARGDGEDTDDPDGHPDAATNPIQLALNVLAVFLQDLPSTVGPAKSITTWTVTVANLVSGFNSYMVAESLVVKACALVTMVSELFGSAISLVRSKMFTLASSIIKIINGDKQGNQSPEAEALVFDFIPALLATIGVGAAAVGFKQIPTDKDAEILVSQINNRLRLFNGSSLALTNIKKIWESLRETVESVTDWLLEQFAPQILAQVKLNRGFEDVEAWATLVDTHYGTDYVDRATWDLDYRNNMLKLRDKAMKFNRLLITGKIGREASIVRDYAKRSLEMALRIEQADNEMPFRIDPYCVCLVGEPGVGKSSIVLSIAHGLMDDLGYPYEKRVCPVNTSEQFFTESYADHSAIYMDDISAFVDDKQYKKFFNLKANTKYTLEMAFNKAKTFTSHFIFTTTNVMYPTPNCVQDHRALQRRRNALIEMAWVRGRPQVHTDDMRNVEFRWRTSEDSQRTSCWVTYPVIRQELREVARLYFQQQRHIVWKMLVDAHMIPPPGIVRMPETEIPVPAITPIEVPPPPVEDPVAEARIARMVRLDMEKIRQHEVYSMYADDGVFENLEWCDEIKNDNGGLYALSEKADAHAANQWALMNEFSGTQADLYRLSHDGIIPIAIAKVRERFLTLKGWLSRRWAEAKDAFPWLVALETWPAKLAAALVVLGGTVGFAARVIHKCICATVRSLGYRCPKCGKWPELDSCAQKEWMLKEWQEIYGPTVEYEAGRITTLEEESAFSEVTDAEPRRRICKGTKVSYDAEAGPYSQDVKGGKHVKVFANGGPYSQDVKGSSRSRVFANAGQRAGEVLTNRVIPYTYRVRGYMRKGTPLEVNCLAIGGRKVLLMKHFVECLGSEEFDIYHNGAWLKVVFKKEELQYIPNKDIVILEMPKQFHLHKSMVSKFVSEKDLGLLKKTSGWLVKQVSTSVVYMAELNEICAEREIKYDMDAEGERPFYVVQGTWKYKQPKSDGACGSALVTSSDKVEGQILGIHVCGNGTYGWSQLITREMLESFVVEKLGTPVPKVTGEAKLLPVGHFGIVGDVSENEGVYQPRQTSIVPTAIHGKIREAVTEPAVLHNQDKRLTRPTHVMRKAIEKYGTPPIQFNEEDMNLVYESLEAEIETWNVQREPRVLTKEEAVLGCPEYEGFERLPLNTSPGYPYVLSRPRGELGKAYLFDINGQIKDKELQTRLDSRLALGQRGERSGSIWTCCLKDERRPLVKVKEGATRLFMIPPVDLSLATRMYTLDFCVAVKDNRHTSFCKVGIDTQSMEWTELYNYLAEFSDVVVAGDFSRFDGTFPPDVSFKYMEHVDSFYKKRGQWTLEDQKVRETLADESVHSVIIAGRTVLVTHIGNKSGDPATVIKNSIGQYYYFGTAWLGLARKSKPDMATMAAFRRHVRMALYGDDSILSIKADVVEWFNQESIATFLSQHGIVYTNSSKTGLTRYQKLDSATFLKCGFFKHESISGIKVPRMNEDTIYELLNWTRIAPDQDELLESNCNDALRFAYFYGRKYFDELRCKIISVLTEESKRFDIMTYNDFHYWFLYVIGKLPHQMKAEAFFEEVAKSGNGRKAKLIGKMFQTIPYHLLSWMGALRSEDESLQRTDNRHAIAIPSGEGKSWLVRHYPDIFVDHDDLLLPAARRILKEHGLSLVQLRKMFDLEFPEDDRRVLLCHHPDNTKRKMLGSYVLPKPNYVRANAFQRLRMKNATRMERDERNTEILQKVKIAEPTLFTSPGCLP